MIVPTNDERWSRIYYRLRDHIINDESWDSRPELSTLDRLEAAFMEHGVRLFRGDSATDTFDGRWTDAELPDGDDLVLFLLRWL